MNFCVCGPGEACDLCREYGRPDGLEVRPTQAEWDRVHASVFPPGSGDVS